MTLLKTLMQKDGLARLATAAPATAPRQNHMTVATAATVAVATSPKTRNHEAINPADAGLPPAWAEMLTHLCTMPPPQGLTKGEWNAVMVECREHLLQHTNQQGETQHG